MTVCIATISEGVVIMVSDRMITSGDIEFEPPSAKVTALTSSIAAMYSGDATLHAEIMQELMVEVRRRIKDDPDDWLKVREMAYLYVRCWTDVKYRRAEIEVLSKYGLNRKTYADQLLTLDPKLVDRISDEISKVRLPSVEVIIAGVDLRFGHAAPSIYHVCDDMVFCADQAAFVAIGTGARHAEAQFMLAKYARSTPNGEALLLAYSAKRDSEVAPGVGKETDVYVIGHQVGASYALGEPLGRNWKLSIRGRFVPRSAWSRKRGLKSTGTWSRSSTNCRRHNSRQMQCWKELRRTPKEQKAELGQAARALRGFGK